MHLLPGGTPGNSWWWCAARFSKSWPYFRPKNVLFRTRFQSWRWSQNAALITCLHKTEIMSSLLRLKPQQIDFLKSISHIALSYSYGIETTHIHKQP